MVELLGTNRRPVNDEVIIISILVNHVLADVSIMFPIWVTVTRPFLGKIQKKKVFLVDESFLYSFLSHV